MTETQNQSYTSKQCYFSYGFSVSVSVLHFSYLSVATWRATTHFYSFTRMSMHNTCLTEIVDD